MKHKIRYQRRFLAIRNHFRNKDTEYLDLTATYKAGYNKGWEDAKKRYKKREED